MGRVEEQKKGEAWKWGERDKGRKGEFQMKERREGMGGGLLWNRRPWSRGVLTTKEAEQEERDEGEIGSEQEAAGSIERKMRRLLHLSAVG